MPIRFNTLLNDADIELSDVRLLRHKDQRANKGKAPYELWRDDRPSFESYQSTQSIENRVRLNGKYWASFVGVPGGKKTLFVGLYHVVYKGVLAVDKPMPHKEGVDIAGSCDEYELKPDSRFADLDGKLFIDWGEGTRSWIQRADSQNKTSLNFLPEAKLRSSPDS